MTQTKKTAKAELNYLRIAPRKVRMVADIIKGLSVNEAEAQLIFQKRRPAKPILKLLHSAVANAKNNQLNPSSLGVVDIRVDQGPRLKRYMPRARGVGNLIEKKMSHVTIVLEESDKFKSRYAVFPTTVKKSLIKEKKKMLKKKPATEKKEEAIKSERPKKPGFFKKVFSQHSSKKG